MLAWLIVGSTTLLACLALGAWPLVHSRRVAPLLQGTLGSLLISAGVFVFASCVGAVAWADSTTAQPPATAEAAATDEPAAAAETIDEGSSSGSQSKPAKPADDEDKSDASSASAADRSQGELSEAIEDAPQSTVIIPPGRPEWVEAPPLHVGDGVHTDPVSSGPFARMQDCWHALDKELVAATSLYIEEHLGSKYAPQLIRYDAKEIRRRFVRPENVYHEQITVSIGPMHQVHALLEFDKGFREELDQRWSEVCKYSRLTQAGLGVGAVLAFLGTIFGYFRLDNATRGYYTGRLQFLTAAAILTIVGVGVVVSRFIHWM